MTGLAWVSLLTVRMVSQPRESEAVVGAEPDTALDRKQGRQVWGAVRRHPGVVLAAFAVVVTVVLAKRYSIANYGNVVDDALISMQYAKRLALGDGLVFNPGERVEGYTNFLWVVLMAPLYALGEALGTQLEPLVVHVNIAFAALNIALLYVLGRKLWGKNLAASAVALGLCVVDNSYTAWAALGLEGHFLGFWMLLALWLTTLRSPRRGLAIGVTLAAAMMTRPDAALFVAFIIAGLYGSWLTARRANDPETKRQEHLRVAVTAMLTVMVVYGAYFAWRCAYYGWLLPNTFYAKVDGDGLNAWSRGATYLREFLEYRCWWPFVALLGLRAATTSPVRACILYLVAHSVYVVYVGGDFFPGQRFFVAQLPLFALAAGLTVHAFAQESPGSVLFRVTERLRSSGAARTALIVSFVALLALVFARGYRFGVYDREILFARDGVQHNRDFMRWLAKNKSSDATFATCSIGTAGFDGEFVRVIDILGLIDPLVAQASVDNFGQGKAGHEKVATLPEILAHKPTYVQREYVVENLWEHGYFFEDRMRFELHDSIAGIWQRDELAERGEYLPETALHFDPGAHEGWTASGSAFERWPAVRRPAKQRFGIGERGAFVDTFDPEFGDLSTGRLLSPPFELRGDKMLLRVGGGFDLKALTVSLWIDGKREFSETGMNSEDLSRREWLVGFFRGKQARLEIVDASQGPRGHIMVDEVVQWRASR